MPQNQSPRLEVFQSPSLPVRCYCLPDSLGISRRLDSELPRELRRVEDILEFTLVEHLGKFSVFYLRDSQLQ